MLQELLQTLGLHFQHHDFQPAEKNRGSSLWGQPIRSDSLAAWIDPDCSVPRAAYGNPLQPGGGGSSYTRTIGSEHALMAGAVEFCCFRLPNRCATEVRACSGKSEQSSIIFDQPHAAFEVGKYIGLLECKRSKSGRLLGITEEVGQDLGQCSNPTENKERRNKEQTPSPKVRLALIARRASPLVRGCLFAI